MGLLEIALTASQWIVAKFTNIKLQRGLNYIMNVALSIGLDAELRDFIYDICTQKKDIRFFIMNIPKIIRVIAVIFQFEVD